MEFERWFRTERACRDYLIQLRWAKGFVCPRCSHTQAWRKHGGLFRCGKCRADISVTAGTIFAGSNLPLRVWFRAAWWITNQKSGVSALGLQRTLGLGSYKTAWGCLHKLRRAMVRPGREHLSGKIEVDEFIVGGYERRVVPARTWRGDTKKAIVVVAAEVRGEGTGRIRLKRVQDLLGSTLTGFVQSVVAPGSEIVADGWRGYNDLPEMGYAHQPTTLMNKGREASNVVLPRVHRVAALLKRWLLGIHQGRVSRKHLDYYLDEFAFRFNRRFSTQRGMLFYRLLQQAVAVGPVPYETVIGGAK